MSKEKKKSSGAGSRKGGLKRILVILCIVFALAVVFFVGSNLLIIGIEKKKVVSDEELTDFKADCILILGAGVKDNGVPSNMLTDRLEVGFRLYEAGVAPKILVSGDHGRENYDEVNSMKKYLMDKGVPGEDIFMDHAGFSTYESMFRAKNIFGVSSLVVVTQEYHLYRSLYICDRMNMEARGVSADLRTYVGTKRRNIREWLARDKDIFTCLFKINPNYLGDKIDIHGDGNVTNDKAEK